MVGRKPDVSSVDFVDEAEVVIVGGGIIGCSIAYHLGRLGIADVLVLERNELSSQATARAAGLLLHASSDRNVIRMVSRTRAAMAELAADFGEDAGFRQVGSLSVIQSQDRLHHTLAIEALLTEEGVEVEPLDARQAQALCPWLAPGDAARITFTSADGYVDGARLGMSYARAARQLGARIRRGVTVDGFIRNGSRVAGVATRDGAVRSGKVVCAAGAWSIELLRGLGWGMPAAPVRSHYWITAPDGTGAPERPNVLLPDLRTYLRPEVGGMVLGFQEPRSQTYDPYGLPETMEAALHYDEAADTDLLVEHAALLRSLIPSLDAWRFSHHIVGLSMYTPDGKLLLGPVPAIEDLLVAGGCCGSGIAMSGGIGFVLAELIAGRNPTIDRGIFDPNRFGDVEPAAASFRELCAAARAGKSRGRNAAPGLTPP
jgi:4-methylaminobutanoate oxidase (formaldehyde-forming)